MTTDCEPLLSTLSAYDRDRWTCRRVAPDTILLVTSRLFADGDRVELLVQTVGDEVIVSDGGEVLARLDSAGVNVSKSRTRASESWATLISSHALEVTAGELIRRASAVDAASLIYEMTDAVANVDGLRLLAPAPRRLKFTETIATYLEAEFPVVEPKPPLLGRSGSRHRPTVAAGNDDRLVYVQAAAGQSTAARQHAVEHSYTMFSDINGHIPVEQKLVVLDDGDASAGGWRPEWLKLLSNVAYVGTWTQRDRWTQFVRDGRPTDRVLALVGSTLWADED